MVSIDTSNKQIIEHIKLQLNWNESNVISSNSCQLSPTLRGKILWTGNYKIAQRLKKGTSMIDKLNSSVEKSREKIFNVFFLNSSFSSLHILKMKKVRRDENYTEKKSSMLIYVVAGSIRERKFYRLDPKYCAIFNVRKKK